MNYDGLKPGIYLQVGDNIKALATVNDGAVKSHGREYLGSFSSLLQQGQMNIEKLAAMVGWVFVAIDRRKQQILEIPHVWQRGGEDLEMPPLAMPFKEHIQQIDESMQYYGCAYLLKQKAGRGLIGTRWLDPTLVEPDYDNATPEEGVPWYYYTRQVGASRVRIPKEDILAFKLPGMRELKPGTPAGEATRLAAQVSYGITQTSNVFFGNNGLPVMIVTVPVGTSESETGRLERFFKRLFNPRIGTKEMRVTAVRGDVKVDSLSLAPKDLAQSELEASQVDLILAAHNVPKSIALANSANYATDIAARRGFVGTMGSRFEYIADVYNQDIDFQRAGFTLVVRTQDHYTMKEDEAQRASAFTSYLQGFTPEASAYLVGIAIEDFPDDMEEIFKGASEPEPEQAPPPPPEMMEEEQQPDNEERQAEMRAYRSWLKKRNNPNMDDFEHYHMTDEEKEFLYWQVKGHQPQRDTTTMTDDLLDQFTKAMERFNESMRSESSTFHNGGNGSSGEGNNGLSPEPESAGEAVLE